MNGMNHCGKGPYSNQGQSHLNGDGRPVGNRPIKNNHESQIQHVPLAAKQRSGQAQMPPHTDALLTANASPETNKLSGIETAQTPGGPAD